MAGKAQPDLTGIMVPADLVASDYLVIAPVLVPLFAGAILLMFRRNPENQGWLATLALAITSVLALGLLQQVIETGPVTMTMGRWLPPFGISFSADLAGAMLALAGNVMALAATVYSTRDIDAGERRYGFYPFLMLMMAGVNGAFLTGDVFNLYVWFEVLLISSFGLIVLGSRRVQLDGTAKYAFLNLIATTMFLTATGYLYGVLGTLNMADIYLKVREPGVEGPLGTIAVLYFLAFAMKAAAFPLNSWLPASYHTPRIVVSAIFAGLLTKVGIYALLRISVMLLGPQRELFSVGIAWVAALTMLVGVLGALAQSDIRRVLGYLVISGIGTMLAGIAIASKTAIAGVVVYAIHSMIVMAALYLAAGMIGRMQQGFNLRQTGGIYAASPMFAAAFLILALSLSGLPPTSGFWGKFILVRAALETGAWWLAAIILISGLLATIAVFRIWIFAFWRGGPEGTRDGAEAWSVQPLDPGYRLAASLSIAVLTAMTLMIGLAPEALVSLSGDAAHEVLFPDRYVDSVFGGSGQ